ncbi:ATP-binding cassette domain-containing protein [Pseudoroseicyclus sp. H15]
MTELVLQIENVSKTYPGVRALDHVSLDARAGEVHAILGENGSGKSTLMKIASGAVTPDSGSVTIAGKALTQADPGLARDLGLSSVYQDDSLVRELTVAQNLFMGAPPGSVPYGQMVSWAEKRLAPFDLGISARARVADLTPAHRQFVEIVKALIAQPRVLLLDEPTSTLDIDGVRQLMGIVRELTLQGTGVLYVSHRLPEILELADRVTILRDGVHQGTFDVTPEISENDLVARMIGRDVESEFPPKLATVSDRVVLSVSGLSGNEFHGLTLQAREGEILGFAGAEGNGQREALRGIVGLDEAQGHVAVMGRPVDVSSPRAALAGGIAFLSADRPGEAIFPDLSVQKNMVLTRLGSFMSRGLLSGARERADGALMKDDFGVAAASLDVPVIGLSGGNQQKAVLARAFRSGARVFLIDEPTQGVDAGARYEIYKAVRENLAEGGACIVNCSDAQELAGICDRVLVFSRGQVVAELTGDEVTEERIVGSFLTSRHGKAKVEGPRPGLFSRIAGGTSQPWVPVAFLAALTLLVGAWSTSQSEVFLTAINLRHLLLAVAPAAIVALAQLVVLLVRGLDVSVGSMMSLTVVAASFLIAGGGPVMILLGALACLALGAVVGLINGSLIRLAGVNAVITTIAMLSVLGGIALVLRPTPAGLIDGGFAEVLRTRIGWLPISTVFVLALALAGDWWLNRTRAGLEVKAVGFREEAARRNGVNVNGVQIRAYVIAGTLAALAGLFLGSEVGVGHPTIGANYALTSIAAAVLGGAALTGGRGSFLGALAGALFFTLMINVLSILGLSSAVGVIASGTLTLLAIFLYSGLREIDRHLRRMRNSRSVRRAAATPAE